MRLLIYGDSNSWGYLDDGSGHRYAGRWPRQMLGRLQEGLGQDRRPVELVEECLPGRVTQGEDPVEGPQFDGVAPLLAILLSHQPLDHVVIMLGTNDMKARFDRSAAEIADGVMNLVAITRASTAGPGGWHATAAPEITVICPPMLGERADDPAWMRYDEWRGGLDKSQMLPAVLARTCAAQKVDFINGNEFAASSDRDPIHWRAETHLTFGTALAEHLLNLYRD